MDYTPVSQAGGRNDPMQLNSWLYSQPEIDTPWNGIDDPAQCAPPEIRSIHSIHESEPQHRRLPIATCTYANQIDAPVGESYCRAAKRKLELVERVNSIDSTLNPNLNEHHPPSTGTIHDHIPSRSAYAINPNLNEHHPSSTGTIHDHIPSRSAYATNPSADGAAGGATNAQSRRRQGSPAKKQRGNGIAKNPQRTGKIPAQGASDDERDEENDQGWRDPKGYPCTYYLAVAGTENDKEFQQGGKYHDCRFQGSNRVGYSSPQGVVETMSVYLYQKRSSQHNSRKHHVKCNTCGRKHTPHAILGRSQACQPNAKTAQQQQRCRTWRDHYVKDHGPNLPMPAEIYVKFGAAMTAMTEAFACFVQRDERARALKHPLYDDWDIGEVAWSVSWFPRDRRSNTSVPDTEAGHPVPSILEFPRPGISSNNNASAHPPPPPAADITPHPHQFPGSHQPSTHNYQHQTDWLFLPSPQQKSMLGPHGQATNARTYRQNSIDFASSDRQGRREEIETGLPRGGEDSNPNRPANSFHTLSNDIAYPQAQLLAKLHANRLAHHCENTLRRVGAWVGDSVYLEGGQPPTSSNRVYTNYGNYLHGTSPQTHGPNEGVVEPLPAGETDTHMIDIFEENSVQLWNELKESAGYAFN